MRPYAESIAVVTGANRERGIGLALVRELVARGIERVVGTYRDVAQSAPLLALAAMDPRVLPLPLDVTDDASVERFGRAVAAQLGRVDLLVNNAGIGDSTDSVLTASVSELELQAQTHGIGMLRVTRALHPLLQSGAVVLNVSSSLGSIAMMPRGWGFYSAAKAFENALTRQLAAPLLEDRVICLCACPGGVNTDMSPGAGRSPATAAVDLLHLVERATEADAGTFLNFDGSPLPW